MESSKYHHPCPDGPPEPCEGFKLEAVIVCEKYGDFLRHTLPHNKAFFDRVVVVTSREDKETQKICEFYHVECVATDALEVASGKFCKAAGINAGLARLSKDGWVIHLDADIWLPPQTRILLERACLNRTMIYGIDRFIVRGYEAWRKFLAKPKLQHECDSYIHLYAFPLGTRVMSRDAGGYIPIGFFQLWNPCESGVYRYPEGHTDAGRSDMLFAKLWRRAHRGFIPEIVGYHLESKDSDYGANWSGRKTARFEPKDSIWKRAWSAITAKKV